MNSTRKRLVAPILMAVQVCCLATVVHAAGAGREVSDTAAAEQAAADKVQVERDAERAVIDSKRKAINTRLTKEEAFCYQQFVVESCLRKARSTARQEDTALRNRELQLNDAERRERAKERLKTINEREQDKQDKKDEGALRAGEIDEKNMAREEGRAQDRQQREQDAQQRAAQQSSREATHAADLEKRRQTEPSRVERARMRFEAKQQRAAEHRVQHEKDLADAAKAGRKPVAPLPSPDSEASGTKP